MTDRAEKPVSEFQRIPEILFNKASQIRLSNEYLVSVQLGSQGSIDVLVTSTFNSEVVPERVENLEKYSKNPDAKDRAVERVFQQAAEGTPVRVQVRDWRGGKATALVIRADMNG